MKNLIRAMSLVALLGAAVASASASVVFSFHAIGSHTVSAGFLTATDSTFFDDLSTPYAPTALTYYYAVTAPSLLAPTAGAGVLTVTGGTINFSFSGAVIGGATGYDAVAGTIVSFSGGTGVLAGLTGTGQISNTIDVTDPTKHRTTFEAALVPEPASMAVLALGLAGVASRRRRKSSI